MERQDRELSNQMERELAIDALLEGKRRKRRKMIRRVVTVLFVLLVVCAALVGITIAVIALGGNSLRKNVLSNRPSLVTEITESTEATADGSQTADEAQSTTQWEEGWVRYDGKVYEYNEDIMTFLVMGVDKMGEVSENPDEVSGGQTDALFLVVANPDDKSVKIVAINRDTMTDISMVGYEGSDRITAGTITAQIATQHGFGDGKELSCELTEEAVSKLFYDLPIHGYVSINMGAIPQLNDAIGGVEVTVLEDLKNTNNKINFTKDDEVSLLGMDAFWYVKYRDTTVFESNRNRLARQKQYLTAFMKKAIESTKKDLTLPITLYGKLNKYMVTDITTEELTYLVGTLINYQFDGDAIYTLEGETIMGEKHEEFYPDSEALRELMIQIFYREVDMQAP